MVRIGGYRVGAVQWAVLLRHEMRARQRAGAWWVLGCFRSRRGREFVGAH